MMDMAAVFFLASGVFFMLLAAIGLVRMPDTYLRSQVTTLASTFGKMGIVLSIACVFGSLAVVIKVALSVIFLFVTAPVAAHLVLRAAYRDRSPLSPLTKVDDYAEAARTRKSFT